MTKPRMILFDYGQTLIDEGNFDGVKGTQAVLKYATRNKYGFSADQVQEEAVKLFRELGRFDTNVMPIEIPNYMFNAYLYESLGITIDLSPDEMDRVFWNAAAPGKATDGIEALLKYLHMSGIRTGVISNIGFEGKVLFERINSILPDNHFEFIVATSEYMFRKPNKRIFNLALEKAELQPCDVWYTGDNYECDILGAKNAGIFPVWYKGALRDNEVVSNPQTNHTGGEMVIVTWDELKSLIQDI